MHEYILYLPKITSSNQRRAISYISKCLAYSFLPYPSPSSTFSLIFWSLSSSLEKLELGLKLGKSQSRLIHCQQARVLYMDSCFSVVTFMNQWLRRGSQTVRRSRIMRFHYPTTPFILRLEPSAIWRKHWNTNTLYNPYCLIFDYTDCQSVQRGKSIG